MTNCLTFLRNVPWNNRVIRARQDISPFLPCKESRVKSLPNIYANLEKRKWPFHNENIKQHFAFAKMESMVIYFACSSLGMLEARVINKSLDNTWGFLQKQIVTIENPREVTAISSIYWFVYFSLPGLVLQCNLVIANVCQRFGITQRPISGQVELKLHSGITPDGGWGRGARGGPPLYAV